MIKRTLTGLLLTFSFWGQAQNVKMTPLKPEAVTARVVGILEGNTQLAVLYILKVDSLNEIGLEEDTEILARFHFDTKPTQGDPKLPGTKSGDVISAEIAGEHDKNSGQMNYLVFRYSVLPTETISTEADDRPRK